MGDPVHVKFCQVAQDQDEGGDEGLETAPHPCDPPRPCDPFKEVEGDCPNPYICFERLKNPALGPTRCMEGAYMNAKECGKRGRGGGGRSSTEEAQHPCDPLPPCSTKKKKRPCLEPTLCYHRIKNPEWPRKPITSDCNPELDK